MIIYTNMLFYHEAKHNSMDELYFVDSWVALAV